MALKTATRMEAGTAVTDHGLEAIQASSSGKLGRWLLPSGYLVYILVTSWQNWARILLYAQHPQGLSRAGQDFSLIRQALNLGLGAVVLLLAASFVGAQLGRILETARSRFVGSIAMYGGALAVLQVLVSRVLHLLLAPAMKGVRVRVEGHFLGRLLGFAITFTIINLAVGLILHLRSVRDQEPRSRWMPLILLLVELAASIPFGILIAQDSGGGCSGGLQGAFSMLILGLICLVLSSTAFISAIHAIQKGISVKNPSIYTIVVMIHSAYLILCVSLLSMR